MQKLKQKLNSKRGVSIVMALLLALICLFAGTAALTAASANIGRHTHLREDQQDYLSISSAARLISDSFTKDYNKLSARCEGGVSSLIGTSLPVGGHLFKLHQDFFNNLLAHCYNKGTDPDAPTSLPAAAEFTVDVVETGDEDNFRTVDVKITPKEPIVSGTIVQDDLEVELSTGDRELKFTVNLKLTINEDTKIISVTEAKVERITLPGIQEETP